MTTKAETIKGALARLAKAPPKAPEIVKLPSEEPKPPKGKGQDAPAFDETHWPKYMYMTDKQLPALLKANPGDEMVLLIKVKVERLTKEERDQKEDRVDGHLVILEVAKL